MALVDEIPLIRPALQAIHGVKRVTTEWPKDWAELPVITINEASNLPAVRYGDREHITELEYYIRVWGRAGAEVETVASKVDDVMVDLGYERTMTYDDDSADVRQKAMRYRKYL
jgi:hypothetical protein